MFVGVYVQLGSCTLLLVFFNVKHCFLYSECMGEKITSIANYKDSTLRTFENKCFVLI